MSTDYIRRCPTCDAENAPQVMRCVCGALLAGVDLIGKSPALAETSAPIEVAIAKTVADAICSYEDCAQPNPPGSGTCLYCNRPIASSTALTTAAQSQSLLSLPQALKDRYRILKPLPVQGAEAELLLVEAHAGGPSRVAKIYRHGIQPRQDVQQRIARIDTQHRVEVLEAGISEGHAYELMEFCVHGSLREQMRAGPLSADLLLVLVRELAGAIVEVHAAGLLHRDLKPENILVRTVEPLDLVLTDFGISSVLDATQRFTGTARTLPYASPESLSGVIDGKADYWAIGMIILEGALGKHPFAGLSEAVILHHLTTRSIDLSGIGDRSLRKLLRGLLVRDPKARWGDDEIRRWLARDASLAEPAEHGVASSFAEPYHLGKEVCHTMEQLAVALAGNWRDGIADMANGLLLSWFRDVQKDQNAVRLLLELRQDSRLSFDLQLLKLILHLAPGIPPVWRGETIELPSILARANLALKGDEEAERWLNLLYQNRVLEAYAKAGNREAADIVQRWHLACDQFEQAWDAGLALIKAKAPARGPGEYANYDLLVYGNSDPHPPSIAAMHPRLLAISYDARWSERLRQRLSAELAGLIVYCPWLADLGTPDTMDAASLLVLESLLPESKKVVERQIKANQRLRESEADECVELKAQLSAAAASIRGAGDSMLMPNACIELKTSIDRYLDLIARIRASGRADLPWQELRKAATRTEARANQLRLLADTLAAHRAENAGWLSPQVLGFFAMAMILLPMFFGLKIDILLMTLVAALAVWRLVPDFSMMRRIRELAESL